MSVGESSIKAKSRHTVNSKDSEGAMLLMAEHTVNLSTSGASTTRLHGAHPETNILLTYL